MSIPTNVEVELSFDSNTGTSPAGKAWGNCAAKTVENDPKFSTFVRIVAFDELASKLKDLTTGTRLRVQGNVRLEKRTDQSGVEKSCLQIFANKIDVTSFVENVAGGGSAMASDEIPFAPEHR